MLKKSSEYENSRKKSQSSLWLGTEGSCPNVFHNDFIFFFLTRLEIVTLNLQLPWKFLLYHWIGSRSLWMGINLWFLWGSISSVVVPSLHFYFFLKLSNLIFAALAEGEMTNEDSRLKLNSSRLSRRSWFSQTVESLVSETVLVFLAAASITKHHRSVW